MDDRDGLAWSPRRLRPADGKSHTCRYDPNRDNGSNGRLGHAHMLEQGNPVHSGAL
jgi:hypothetical protein